MAIMVRSDFKKSLQDGLNSIFGMEYKMRPEQWRSIFVSENSKKAYEEDVLYTGLGQARVKAEGANVQYDSGSEAGVARYINETIALAFAITEEAVEDNLYGDLGAKYSKALARSFQDTKNVKGASVLNNGFSSTYPGYDGVSLFNTAHPLRSGATLSNTFTTPAQLSESSLEEAIIAIGNWTDDRGLKINAMVKNLIVPNELRFVAEKIMKSQYTLGTNNNDPNVVKNEVGGWSVNNFLTDVDNWFLITDISDGLKHFIRVPMQKGMEGDFETGNLRYKGRERYSFGWSDFRGAFGSQAS